MLPVVQIYMHDVCMLHVTAMWEKVAQSTFARLGVASKYFRGLPAPDESLFLFDVQATSKLYLNFHQAASKAV